MWRRLIFLYLAIFIVIADQLTKQWIRNILAPGESFEEVFRVTIIHLQNTGAAFGFFTDQTFMLTFVALIGIAIIIVFYRKYGNKSKLGTIAMGMILGGAAGNVIDRIRLGHVTDFFYVRMWGSTYFPAFNVADSCITIGMILLILFLFKEMKNQDESKS